MDPLPSHRYPQMYLVITNISKRNNIKSLVQTAAACGCVGIFVVGQPRCTFDMDQSMDKMPVMRFAKWNDCVQYLREGNILLVGVEIHPNAVSVEDFRRSLLLQEEQHQDVAFLMGNEGQGIHEKHMASCQAFVKIPQYGSGTASLNVNVAASIVLHSFHLMLRTDLE
jgi:tRNA G18 (ribose-2'-O)-methylase SpoU